MAAPGAEIRNPSAYVWDLVSGFASCQRGKRGMMVLQACVDDSGHVTGPIFVLGGFLADSGEWAKFSDEWHYELNRGKSVDYFKASEAFSLHKQFSIDKGWNRNQRDDKVSKLCDIIKRYVSIRMHVSIDVLAFDKIMQPNKIFRNHNACKPYFLAYLKIIYQMIQVQCIKFGTPNPVAFIFDRQGNIGDEAQLALMGAYSYVKMIQLPNGKTISDCLKTSPIFEDDKTFMPLQAADLYAWCVNRQWHNYQNKSERLQADPFELLQLIPTIQFHYGEKELHAVMADYPKQLFRDIADWPSGAVLP